MTQTTLTKANEKYLTLLDEVESAEAVVKECEARLKEWRDHLASKKANVTKFEGKHVGETLLKPYKVPAPSSCGYTITVGGSGYYMHTFNG